MRPHFVIATALLLLGGLAACGDDAAQPAPSPSAAPPPAVDDNARNDLVARAALAQDKSYAALYSLDDGTGTPRDVVATIAADGTWRVDVAKGAFGGTTDESIVSTPAGVYQCTVATAANPITPACVRVANPGKPVPAKYDPSVERLFQPALNVFTDRQAAIAVTEVAPLAGVKGDCYSIDSISAALDAPVDVGIYCYAADGVLTGVRVGFGVLKLVNQVAGPKTVGLPGQVVDEAPMETASPEPPSAPTGAGSGAPSPA
ncbi:hypothetical protein HH310_13590 [Actinoplanes sp. TBRC 11911]|uniref:hypothetical protein n=1 Tax=Actinoplanes sp. TBRC 11911 TaxID=2729386 RepID=UPI00145F90F9|nr:hypothetical protein [Actinoplanes sp. TBRC 11911]NMO52226.1 hypothetical protein [Actinoplanes sp. TBRC 11911]